MRKKRSERQIFPLSLLNISRTLKRSCSPNYVFSSVVPTDRRSELAMGTGSTDLSLLLIFAGYTLFRRPQRHGYPG